MAGRYEAADALGHFSAQPRQAPREEASPPNASFDFDELDADPTERKPGSALAKRLWAAETQVRQWKWLSVGLLFLLAMFLQSIAMYFATRRYVQWVGDVRAKDSKSADSPDPHEVELTMRLLQPRDTFAMSLGIREVSSVPLDVAMLLMPLTWLVATISARNLRLWTRTLLSASVLALFTGALGSLTMLPQPMGWEACEANLREDVLLHYTGSDQAVPEVGKAIGLIFWIWLQDVLLGLRFQGQIVCAGSSLSGCSWFTALFALALYDLSRMWSRKMKPHFREISHFACGGVLTAFVLLDATVAITSEKAYTAAVTMGFVMAMLVYSSPAIAVCTDQLLIRSTPSLQEVTKGETETSMPLRESTATSRLSFFPRDDLSRDFGDVVIPPCCIPFCAFHGRYFLYPKPASEYEQELLANLQAQAELERLQKEQEQSTLRLLDLEGQLQALHTRQAKRVEEEPKEFEQQLQERLHQQRMVFEEHLARVQADIEEAQREKQRLEAEAQANERREELLLSASRSHAGAKAASLSMLSMPEEAWAKIYALFEQVSPDPLPLPRVELEVLPTANRQPPPTSVQVSSTEMENPSLAAKAAFLPVANGDFRQLPSDAWQRLHERFGTGRPKATCVVLPAPEPEAAFLPVANGDFRQLPSDAWQRLHERFGTERPKATMEPLLPPEVEKIGETFEKDVKLPFWTASLPGKKAAHLRPSATPHLGIRWKQQIY